MSHLNAFLMLLGRLLIAAIFILSGASKLMDWEGTSAYMASKGMTMIPFFLVSAAFVEIVLGLGVLLGIMTRISALILFLFLIPTTLIFHNFWSVELIVKKLQIIHFMKNMGIMGGLLYVIANGAGKYSFDSLFFKKD